MAFITSMLVTMPTSACSCSITTTRWMLLATIKATASLAGASGCTPQTSGVITSDTGRSPATTLCVSPSMRSLRESTPTTLPAASQTGAPVMPLALRLHTA